ncbi:MAG: hypothetical protein Q7T57_07540, partial [Dehalococcoidales bacterium]|nr:hypothetical protein [Dehalococcoidales bacterium]
ASAAAGGGSADVDDDTPLDTLVKHESKSNATDGGDDDTQMKTEDGTTTATGATDAATATAAPIEENEDVCEICFSGDIEDEDLILYCDGTGADGKPCTTIVHQGCYGVFKVRRLHGHAAKASELVRFDTVYSLSLILSLCHRCPMVIGSVTVVPFVAV